ncbi:hypothetical protein CCHL11_07531 [Colletotrichum chlorophyti]|uniref:Uncharacterized protein n=1 Tax=Colletotrichum chlorophyti TaxID=708187 RepID=A0A1Q8S496_9PEZI|nr:hypothetical protein CCHL11_07531 [Colletotrichum chlorophyti]
MLSFRFRELSQTSPLLYRLLHNLIRQSRRTEATPAVLRLLLGVNLPRAPAVVPVKQPAAAPSKPPVAATFKASTATAPTPAQQGVFQSLLGGLRGGLGGWCCWWCWRSKQSYRRPARSQRKVTGAFGALQILSVVLLVVVVGRAAWAEKR